jgi:hypothetical protein
MISSLKLREAPPKGFRFFLDFWILLSYKAKFDGIVKSFQSRHSREGGSPELLEIPGFPFSRE